MNQGSFRLAEPSQRRRAIPSLVFLCVNDFGIDRLSPAERIALALEIWDSLEDARPTGRLTEEQRDELARRDEELEANPGIALNWGQIRVRVEAQP